MSEFLLSLVMLLLGCDLMIFSGDVGRTTFYDSFPNAVVEEFTMSFTGSASRSFDNFDVTENNASGNASVNWRNPTPTMDTFLTSPALGFTWSNPDPATMDPTVTKDLTFEFDFSIGGFAADIIDFGTVANAEQFRVSGFAGSTAVFSDVVAATANPNRGNTQFFGVTSTTPFDTLVFTHYQQPSVPDPVPVVNDLIIFDNVAFVPEPNAGKIMLAVACVNLVGVLYVRLFRVAARNSSQPR